jgi:hypothetical protein
MGVAWLRAFSWSHRADPGVAHEPSVRLLDEPSREPASAAERWALRVLARNGDLSLQRLVDHIARELYREEMRRGGWAADIGFAGSALFRADAEHVVEGAADSLWTIDRQHN